MHILHPARLPVPCPFPTPVDVSVLLETRQPDAMLLVPQRWGCVGGMHSRSHPIAVVGAVQL